jgi:hypothetical protein
MKKQTAVDWLVQQIESGEISVYNYGDKKILHSFANPTIIEQAKQMEKEQIVEAWVGRDN